MTVRVRNLVIAAVVLNLLVFGGCIVAYGWTQFGVGSAARNTARVASVIFLVSFASAGLKRWLPALNSIALARAFVAAQLVHYASVIMLHEKFGVAPPLNSVKMIAFSTGGLLLAVIYGLTIEDKGGRLVPSLNRLCAYLMFLIYAANYSQHKVHALRWMSVLVVASLVLRWMERRGEMGVKRATA